MIKCVLFDMDGVLINSEPVHFEIWKQIFAEQGIAISYDVYKGCIGSTVNRLFELVLEGYGRDFRGNPAVPERFRELKNIYIREKGIPEIKGVCELVRSLKADGYTLAVASSSPQDYIEIIVKQLGLSDCFDLLFSAERVARPKPAPDVFLTAAEALGMKPEECLVVEDSENGSKAAKAAGMMCYGFVNPDSGNQDLSAADCLFYSFKEFPAKIPQK